MKMSRRKWILIVSLLLYVGAYVTISRVNSLDKVWRPGFFTYLPPSSGAYDNVLGEDDSTRSNHNRVLAGLDFGLVIFFYPIWLVDHNVFGGPTFIRS